MEPSWNSALRATEPDTGDDRGGHCVPEHAGAGHGDSSGADKHVWEQGRRHGAGAGRGLRGYSADNGAVSLG
jgi:hypothetical protein